MVNSDLARGTVIFGIEADGTVCGIEQGNLDIAQRSLSQTIRNKFDPQLVVQMEVGELNARQVLVLMSITTIYDPPLTTDIDPPG